MKERLVKLMELLNMSPTQFAVAIGVQRATLQHIISGRNEPSLKIIMAIHNAFPDVELEWLLSGKGTAIPGLQQNDRPDPEYPLLPGMESAFFPANTPDVQDFSILRDQEEPQKQRKRRNNKEVMNQSDSNQPCHAKRIKEVVVFFEDGTYQKFLSELKN